MPSPPENLREIHAEAQLRSPSQSEDRPSTGPINAIEKRVHGVQTLPRLRDALQAMNAVDLDDNHQYFPLPFFGCQRCPGHCSCQENGRLPEKTPVQPFQTSPHQLSREHRPRLPPPSMGFELQRGTESLTAYHLELMLLEQQRKKRYMTAAQIQDNIPRPWPASRSTSSRTPSPKAKQTSSAIVSDSLSKSIQLPRLHSQSTSVERPCCETSCIQRPASSASDQAGPMSPSDLHSLFHYCPHTVRVGCDPHSNRIRELIQEWRTRNALSLDDLITLRSKRTPRELYGWAEKARSNNGESGHVKDERRRRLNHRDFFAETDLRLPDFAVKLALDYKSEIIGRGMKATKPGKDELHIAMLIILDFDALVIEEQQKQDKQRISDIEKYRTLYGALKDTGLSSSTKPRSPKRPRADEERFQEPVTRITVRSGSSEVRELAFVDRQVDAHRLSSKFEDNSDKYHSLNVSPRKRQRRSLKITTRPAVVRGAAPSKNLPSPTPSASSSWEHVNRIQGEGSTSSCTSD